MFCLINVFSTSITLNLIPITNTNSNTVICVKSYYSVGHCVAALMDFCIKFFVQGHIIGEVMRCRGVLSIYTVILKHSQHILTMD